ncbi:hypothetical protein [Yinghuangia sp. YIM S09857]|uniref:hypothetical protein n=1 Tax=Yinghuangia sp. YIM S09857 TaxID=3436929 RepID=UPI003F53BF27
MTESTDMIARPVAGAVWHDHAGFRVRVERLLVENGRPMVEYRGLDDPQAHHVFTQENFLHVFAPATAARHHGEGAAIRAAVAEAIVTTGKLAHPRTGVLVELAHRARGLAAAIAALPDHGDAADRDAEVAAEEVSDLLHRAAEALRRVADEQIRPAVELLDAELTHPTGGIDGTAANDPAP